MINNIYELAKFYGIDNADELTAEEIDIKLNRLLFKYTESGMSIHIEEDGIMYIGIVEGWDEGSIDSSKLFYPIDEKDINDWAEIINRRACMCWDAINGEGEYEKLSEDERWMIAMDLAIYG